MRLPAPRRRWLAGLAAGLCLTLGSSVAAQGRSWAVRGGTLIDGTGRPPIANSVVSGDGDRLTCVGTTEACPIGADTTIVDAMGRWVIPGLIDTHVHLNWDADGSAEAIQSKRLAFGITTTRDAGTPGQLDRALAARLRARAPTAPEPRLVVAGLVSTEPGQNVAEEVRRLASLGVDAIKIKQEFAEADLRTIVHEAHAAGLPVFGHTWSDTSRLAEAVEAGIDGVSHMWTFSAFGERTGTDRPARPGGVEYWIWAEEQWNYQDDQRLQSAIEMIVRRRVWVEPMLVADRHFTVAYPVPSDVAFLGEVPTLEQIARAWLPIGASGFVQRRDRRRRIDIVFSRMCDFIRRLHDRGGVTITGTDDTLPGLSLPDEVGLLAGCGLSPLDALRAATERAAQALDAPDIGTLQAGKLADFVILDRDPLESTSNLRRVWRVAKGGNLYDPNDLLQPTIEDFRARQRAAWVTRTLAAVGLVGMAAGAGMIARRWLRASGRGQPPVTA